MTISEWLSSVVATWAALQLPPALIDYILVHELAHLRHANHTPEFWSTVSRLMPAYESQKTTLASIGHNIWLGTTAHGSGQIPPGQGAQSGPSAGKRSNA